MMSENCKLVDSQDLKRAGVRGVGYSGKEVRKEVLAGPTLLHVGADPGPRSPTSMVAGSAPCRPEWT